MVYVIWSWEHQMWWNPDAQGYTTDLEEAGRYTAVQAERHTLGLPNWGEMAIPDRIAMQYGPPRFHPFLGKKFKGARFR